MSAYEFLSDLLVEKFDVPVDRITPEADLRDLIPDSLSIVELLFEMEDKFDIEISEEDSDFKSLGEAAAIVDKLVEAGED